MTITYNWNIVTCEHSIATGGITIAHWKVVAVDGDYQSSSIGVSSFSPDPSSEEFTPYDQVTEAQVLEWCWNNDVDKQAMEAALLNKIELQKNPVTGEGTPW